MKFATTATVIAAALAMFNPAEAKLRGSRMDMDDNVGGFAGAMTSPAAFRIANWGQRVGPFVGPMKSAMGFDVDDELGRPAHTRGNGRTYMSNGYRMNSAGYLANPSRSAQIRARNAGALTNREARSMGLTNRRDMDDDVGAAWALAGKLIIAKETITTCIMKGNKSGMPEL